MPHLRPLSWNDFEEMSIDENTGLLYWKDDPVATEQRVQLKSLVNVSAVITAVATSLLALASWIRLLQG